MASEKRHAAVGNLVQQANEPKGVVASGRRLPKRR
jgi:hypothetical protein